MLEVPERPGPAERLVIAQRLERALKEALRGELTPGSGSKSIKGDVRSDLAVGEAKYRWEWDPERGYWMTLQLDWLETLWTHATAQQKIPVLGLEWGDGRRIALLPENSFAELDSTPSTGHSFLGLRGRNPEVTPGELTGSDLVSSFPQLALVEKHWRALSFSALRQLMAAHLQPPRTFRRSPSNLGGGKGWNRPNRPRRWDRP